jgi:hypothetical protein
MGANAVLSKCTDAFKKLAEEQFQEEFGEPKFMGKDGNKKAYAEHVRIHGIEDSAERMIEEKKFKNRRTRIVGEYSYKSETWKNWERIICRVDFTDKGLDIHYVVVSKQSGIPERIYEDEYCKRGLAEQSIGRYKQTRQRLSAQPFYTNQLRLTLYGVAYMLLMHLRERAVKRLRCADCDTLRKN